MRMSQGYSLRTCLKLECPVCLQYFDAEERDRTAQDVTLFGSKGYKVCINCRQEVPEEMVTDEYKQRFDEKRKERDA